MASWAIAALCETYSGKRSWSRRGFIAVWFYPITEDKVRLMERELAERRAGAG